MSTVKTAKLLNGLLDSQKTDRARLQLLERRLAEADTQQAAAVTAAATAAEIQFKAQLDRVLKQGATEHGALTELTANKDWQITQLKQELSGARQLLAAADASNEELRSLVETLGDNLDKATQAAAARADEQAEIVKQREGLNRLLDEVREHMRKKDYDRERAILNRGVLARAAPGVNRK
jgi:DNA repair exonuclease SbcCD ATPase subunit